MNGYEECHSRGCRVTDENVLRRLLCTGLMRSCNACSLRKRLTWWSSISYITSCQGFHSFLPFCERRQTEDKLVKEYYCGPGGWHDIGLFTSWRNSTCTVGLTVPRRFSLKISVCLTLRLHLKNVKFVSVMLFLIVSSSWLTAYYDRYSNQWVLLRSSHRAMSN